MRFHNALREITGRRGIRNDVSRYESVALGMVEAMGAQAGEVLADFPPIGSALHMGGFFHTLYLRYEERFLIGAPDLKSTTRRLEWSPRSPVFDQAQPGFDAFPRLDYEPRIAEES